MSDTTLKLPFIKKDAQVSIVLGTQIITNLQHTLTYILDTHTQEELSNLQQLAATGEPYPAWALHSSTLTLLLTTILNSAISADQIYYQTLEEAMMSLAT